MKPKMHTYPVYVDIADRSSSSRGIFYSDGKRMPFQVATIKFPKGTLFLEYVLVKALDFEDNEAAMYFHVNPKAQFKSNVYPDTVMEFSL